jgi:uncharacterized protein with FMN-binding domain
MPRKTRIAVANSVIAAAALAGAIGLTNHFTGNSSNTITSSSSSSNQGGSGSTSTSAPAATGKTGTATSDAIPYQFGQVQVSVTEVNGKITAIGVGNSTATNGRAAAFPYLVKYAIAAQGNNFSNLSGATYTTDAFKQALSSAISKL